MSTPEYNGKFALPRLADFTSPTLGDVAPPQNLEAERGVIGSMILDASTIDDVMPFLKPIHFWRDTHQILCRAIFDLRDQGLGSDTITLEEHLAKIGMLERIGGVQAIFDIVASVPIAANATYWAHIVHEKAVARNLIEAHHKGLSRAYSYHHSAEDLLKLAEADLTSVSGDAEIGEAGTLLESVYDALKAVDDLRTGKVVGVGTGLAPIDQILGYMKPGQLHVLGARPSMGKTALAVQIGLNIAAIKRPVLLISLEMTRVQIVNRILSAISGVEGKKVQNPKDRINDDERERLGLAADWLLKLPLRIDDTPSLTVGQIAAHARRAKSKLGGLGLIVVDYIQLITPENHRSNRNEQVANDSKRLKSVARELGCPLVALSQLNRAVEHRDDHRPTLADLRDSGAIEQDADTVTFLYRPDYYDPNDQPGIAEAIVAKNREGETGTARLYFDRSITQFREPRGGE